MYNRSVIKPHHEELVYATVAKAQVAASDGLVIGKAKVRIFLILSR